MVHLVVTGPGDCAKILHKATEVCHDAGIKHTTIEVDIKRAGRHLQLLTNSLLASSI